MFGLASFSLDLKHSAGQSISDRSHLKYIFVEASELRSS